MLLKAAHLCVPHILQPYIVLVEQRLTVLAAVMEHLAHQKSYYMLLWYYNVTIWILVQRSGAKPPSHHQLWLVLTRFDCRVPAGQVLASVFANSAPLFTTHLVQCDQAFAK